MYLYNNTVGHLVIALIFVRPFSLKQNEKQKLKWCNKHTMRSVLFKYVLLSKIYCIKSVTTGTQQSVLFGTVELHMLLTRNVLAST
jgi:hypothetical protein